MASQQKKSIPILMFHIGGISMVIILQRYLTFYFDTLTLNFFRLSAGAILLLSLSIFFYPGEMKRALTDRRLMLYMFLLASVASIAQCLIIEGLSQTSATLVGLIRVIGIILGGMIAYISFHDERTSVQKSNFRLGAVLTIVGITGVILGRQNITIDYSMGSLYTILGICIASSGTVFQKRVVTSLHPISGSAIVAGIMSLIYALVAFQWGDISALGTVPWYITALLFTSGIFGLFVGMGLGFISIRSFGIITHRIFLLVVPFLVGVLSYFFLDEHLTLIQIIFGAILIYGSYLVIRARARQKQVNDTAAN